MADITNWSQHISHQTCRKAQNLTPQVAPNNWAKLVLNSEPICHRIALDEKLHINIIETLVQGLPH